MKGFLLVLFVLVVAIGCASQANAHNGRGFYGNSFRGGYGHGFGGYGFNNFYPAYPVAVSYVPAYPVGYGGYGGYGGGCGNILGYGGGGYGGFAGAGYGVTYPSFAYSVPSYGYNNAFFFNRFRRGFFGRSFSR